MKEEHHYQVACDSAVKLALTCVFKNKEKELCNYESIQILMCAEFGPSWPAIKTNPTHPQFEFSNLKYKSLISMPPVQIKDMARS